ncbi:MAG: transaldolase [Planctomycetes bacterium]|nr:transaldolase [Planctomycetota bacterium]
MNNSPLLKLADAGQSVWFDNISRELIKSGGLEKLRIRGIRGVTSNPTIFQKAIAETNFYDSAIEKLGRRGLDARAIFDQLAIEDIRAACDVLKPVYDATNGNDGYVSLEVSPELAYNSSGTLADANRLWQAVSKPNLMIKIPGTPEGLPAIRDAIAAGININVTLLFAVDAHAAVLDAYMTGLEQRARAGQPINNISSVASFFVSRVDSLIDKQLEEKAAKAGGADAERIRALSGRAAIENARLAYKLFLDRTASPRWQLLKAKGARVQRPLWASTSTKNPKYRDVIYCEQLIGQDTVNTMPPATVEAFDNHGVVAATLPGDVNNSRAFLAQLESAGINMNTVCKTLVDEGVKSFAKSFTDLLAAVEQKRAALVKA